MPVPRLTSGPFRPTPTSFAAAAFATLAGLAVGTTPVHARLVALDILRTDTPAFEGRAFGTAGQYELIVARARGEVDPADPKNALITDLALAPRNAAGKVEYATDVAILKPVDLAKGNGRMFYEVLNRGRKLALGDFNDAVDRTDEPKTAAHAGNGFLMRQGYAIVWSGWESGAIIGTTNAMMAAQFPVAKNADGSRITGRTIFEFAFDDPKADRFRLVYPAATTDPAQAALTIRASSRDARKPVPAAAWSFVDARTVKIDRAHPALAGYDNGAAYELVYTAADPIVTGLGFAATRDVVSFLRHDTSPANPLNGAIRHALAQGTSQSGRFVKGFVYLGFNQDEAGRKVFEGVDAHISGAHAIAANDRWGDNNATGRVFHRHMIAKMEFPFTWEVRTDPYTGKSDGLLARCRASNTCPRVLHTDSANESYLKASMLVTTDGQGKDIELPTEVRAFSILSTEHGPPAKPTAGICQQPGNPSRWQPYLRALIVALDAWATTGTEPPPSLHPKYANGTLVAPLPQAAHGFPAIPGVTYNGWMNPVALVDRSVLPAVEVAGRSYVVAVPKVDTDGNDLGGIRTVDVRVPVATYTGWGVRRAGFAEGEDCGLQGQIIPFAATKAERTAKGDPRLSIEERYADHADYVKRVEAAAGELVRDRLLLAEDAQAMVKAADASGVRR